MKPTFVLFNQEKSKVAVNLRHVMWLDVYLDKVLMSLETVAQKLSAQTGPKTHSQIIQKIAADYHVVTIDQFGASVMTTRSATATVVVLVHDSRKTIIFPRGLKTIGFSKTPDDKYGEIAVHAHNESWVIKGPVVDSDSIVKILDLISL